MNNIPSLICELVRESREHPEQKHAISLKLATGELEVVTATPLLLSDEERRVIVVIHGAHEELMLEIATALAAKLDHSFNDEDLNARLDELRREQADEWTSQLEEAKAELRGRPELSDEDRERLLEVFHHTKLDSLTTEHHAARETERVQYWVDEATELARD